MTRKATEDEIENLFKAVKNNNSTFIKDFFDANKDVDINTVQDPDTDFLILHHASREAPTTELLTTLVKYGANINKLDIYGQSPLHYAVRKSKGDNCIKDLIELGANPTIKDKHGYDPLEALIRLGAMPQKNEVKKLEQYISSYPDIKDQIQKKYVGHLAASVGSQKMLEFLISQGYYDTNRKNGQDKTLAHVAVEGTKDINDLRDGTNTSVDNMISYLGAQMEDIHTATSSGITPLHIAVSRAPYYNKVSHPVKSLIELGAPIDAQTEEKLSPLHLASLNCDSETVKLLLENNANVDLQDKNGNTPLHYAALAKDTTMVELLKKYKPDLLKKNQLGYTPLELVKSDTRLEHKITNRTLQELFKDGDLLVRSTKAKDEMYHLHLNSITGNYLNVDHSGNRYRSCSLLVPGIKMQFYSQNPEALLYNADKSTIRAYMLQDGYTNYYQAGDTKVKFNNINQDKKAFQNTLSRQEFMIDYAEYFDKELRDKPVKNFNEVLANLYPESLVAIVSTSNYQRQIDALEAKYYISEKYNYDLPIVIVENGKVQVWSPKLSEIKEIKEKANRRTPFQEGVLENIESGLKEYEGQEDIWAEEINELYEKKERMEEEFNQEIDYNKPEGGFIIDKNNCVVPLNKNDITAKEVEEFFSQQNTGNNNKTYMDKLLELVNTRLKNDDLPIIDKLDDFIIHKTDIKNLIHDIDKGMVLKDKNYKANTAKDLEDLSNEVIKSMQSHRPSKGTFAKFINYKSVIEVLEERKPEEITPKQIAEQISSDLKKSEKIKEFFNKVLPIKRVSSMSKAGEVVR